jgi:predicted DNA-binding ribbon-helix-helix protein
MVNESQLLVERVQTGVRMEKRLLKVLKALAEYHDMSLGDLLEGIVLHAFDLDSSASHRLTEIKRRSGNKTVSGKKK